LVNLDQREYFDFLPAQFFALLLNKAEMSFIGKIRIGIKLALVIHRVFGTAGLVRVLTYPVRRLK
jgi:hypothetical protein